jgi:hypothetical protein
MQPNNQEINIEPEVLTDNRMRFIRLIESAEEREYCAEYEVASEVRIPGQLTYEDGDVVMRFITMEPNRDGLLKYTLSISAPAEYRLPRYQASKDGYYFQGGGADEILSLASLYLRCRFFPIAYVFRGMTGPAMTKTEHDFSYIRPKRNVDRFLFDEEGRNFVNLGEFLNKVRSLPENLHHEFANAVRLYALAVREIGSNDELAYIHLVSAIEILSKSYELQAYQDLLLPVINQIRDLLSGAGAEAKSELGNLFEQRKSTMKFVSFIQKHSEDSIPERPLADALENKIYKDNLPNALKRIYRARSKFLHEGNSMYMSIPGMTVANCDYDSSLGGTIDNRELDPQEKIPNISFFEGLVRGCLLSYLEENI